VNTGEVFAVVGIVLGMFLNFFVYNRYIWKKEVPAASPNSSQLRAIPHDLGLPPPSRE
jgi:hypothetical protein